MNPIQEGQPAPNFALQDADGQTVTLESLRGQHVIVYFYPQDETPGCTKEACAFRDHWQALQAAGAQVVGISPDDADSHQRFRDHHHLPFPLLSDPDKSVMSKYGAWGEKNLYGKKTIGAIRSTVWIDPQGLVKKHWKRVSRAEQHPAKVLEALESSKGVG